MAQGDVEIARRFLGALDRRDYEASILLLQDDAEWHNTAAFPGPRTIVGPTAIIEFWQGLVETFDQAEGGTEIEDATISGESVVIGVRTRGRGTTSGVPIDVRWALRVSVRGGRIERVDVSGDYASALAAAGLE